MAFAPGLNSQILDHPEKDSGLFCSARSDEGKKKVL